MQHFTQVSPLYANVDSNESAHQHIFPPSSLFFIDHNLGVESGVRLFQVCAYTTFINEIPELHVS